MDCRLTLNRHENFLHQLTTAFEQKEKVSLLIDNDGLERQEGFIKNISTEGENPFIELDNTIPISIPSIVALNGIFLSDYGEC